MSSSSSDAALTGAGPQRALSPRLGAALAASVALHLYGLALLEAMPRGMSWGELSMLEPGGRAKTLRAVLRPEAPAWTPPVAPALPQAAPKPAPSEPVPAPSGQPGGSAAAPTLSPLPPQRYFQTRELDVRPGILVRVEPEYPEAAARRFLSGRVIARLLIDESGAVERVAIVSADPPGYFEESATRAFMAARFTPGMKDGRAVRVQMLLEVTFDSPPPPRPAGVTS